MTQGGQSQELMVAPEPRAMLAGMEPRALVEAATDVANALKSVIEEQDLSIQLGDPKYNDPHVKFPGWLTAGAMLQTFPHVVHSEVTRNAEGRVSGAKATAEARTLDGRVVSRADALCTRDEQQKLRRGGIRYPWSEENATLNQMLSMAETRAAAKAMSFALRWIITMAGFSGTPAEEMDEGNGEPEPEKPTMAGPPAAEASGVMDEELRDTVAPELARSRRPRDPARRAARERQQAEAEAVPEFQPWEEFFRAHGIVATQAVAMIRAHHSTALQPEEDEKDSWPAIVNIGDELPEGGKAKRSHAEASRANELQRAAAKLTGLDPARAHAAQEMLVAIMQDATRKAEGESA